MSSDDNENETNKSWQAYDVMISISGPKLALSVGHATLTEIRQVMMTNDNKNEKKLPFHEAHDT